MSGLRTDQVRVRVTEFRLAHTFLDWQVIDLALQSHKKVGVSLYDTLGKDAVGT